MTNTESMSRERALAIAIVTYRRPGDLATALPSVLAEAATLDPPAGLVVVDNDPDGSAAEIVATFPGVEYLREPVPGIAAARNAALDHADRTGLLVFIDDDEHPQPGWLAALHRTWSETGATAVAGAVLSEFDAPPPEWIVKGGYFDRGRHPTGTPVGTAATNNLLLDLAQIAPHGLRFDEAFGLTGGSDTLFTRQLVRQGGTMIWCDEAIVVDRVPVARMTREWVLNRAFRSGNTSSRVEVSLSTSATQRLRVRVRETGRGLVRIVGGTMRWAAGSVLRSDTHRLRGRRSVSRGSGMIAGAHGRFFNEYARVPARQPADAGAS